MKAPLDERSRITRRIAKARRRLERKDGGPAQAAHEMAKVVKLTTRLEELNAND